MQTGERPTYAKTVVTASYVNRRGLVTQVHPSQFQRQESNTLKTKQFLNQLAKQERNGSRHSTLDRSNSIDYGSLKSRIFEYKVDSNRLSENGLNGFPSDADILKPRALKPLIISKSSPCSSLSEALSREVFSSGSIPTNREIDHLIDVIKSLRQRNVAEEDSKLRYRRHSDVSDLRRSKRRIKDPPTRSRVPSDKQTRKFGSSCSAFKAIEPIIKRNCSEETIPEEEPVEEEPVTAPLIQPERLYPVLSPLEDHMPPPTEYKPGKVDLPEKEPTSAEPSPTTSEPELLPQTPPDNSLRTTPSPDNETHQPPSPPKDPPPQTFVKKRHSFSYGGFSVRNPTASQRTLSSTPGNFTSGPDDFVIQHTLLRRARLRHHQCSQPCVGGGKDDGVEKLPTCARYSPNTHPRAQPQSALAACSGNHPPVSYLNFFRRSKSLQVNHIALHEFRNLQRKHEHRLNYAEEEEEETSEDLTEVTDKDSTLDTESTLDKSSTLGHESTLEKSSTLGNESTLGKDSTSDPTLSLEAPTPDPLSRVNYVKDNEVPTTSTAYSAPQVTRSPLLLRPDPLPRRRCASLGDPSLNVTEVAQVKDMFKRVGRKYLSDQCVLPSSNYPDIEKQKSLSFVFQDNRELYEKVRSFFQETNKSYCKRLIRQRFASNPLECTPEGSLAGDLEQGARPLSEFAEAVSAHCQSKMIRSFNENLHSYLHKTEDLNSNKCANFGDQEKLTKSDNFLDSLTSPSAHPPDLPPPPVAPASSPTLPARTSFSSNNSVVSECPFKNNVSKMTSRDSGYGDSTSTSAEVLNPPPKQRSRSASLIILSKLKPLFGLKKRGASVPSGDNPFHKILEDNPISEFQKSIDTFIARRSSLPTDVANETLPPSSPYEDKPVFDSPSNNISHSSAINTQNVLEGFDSILESHPLVMTTHEGSDEDDDFRVSPLPEDGEGDDEVFHVLRKSYEDVTVEEGTVKEVEEAVPGPSTTRHQPHDNFSLQDIQEILDAVQLSENGEDVEQLKMQNILQSKLTVAMSSIYDTLINSKIPPNAPHFLARDVLEDTLDYLDERLDVEEDNANILELVGLLETFEDYIELHDEIISRSYYENETLPEMKVTGGSGSGTESNSNHSIYRMVGLHKNKGEPLGITLKKEEEKVVVHRILAGGMIDRQRLLHIGDVIISVNGQDVEPRPDLIQRVLKDQEGDIQLKIIPSYREQAPACQVYVKAHFNYDPKTDNMIPCKDAGLKFNEGDILQIVNQDDPNWWQAKLEGGEGQAGLIPGLILQEQRMASQNLNNDQKSSSIGCGGPKRRRKKKNKKMNYSANKNSDFDQHELTLYEEVAKMPPFNRKTLVLIGAQGVGRRSLISKLVLNEPAKFGNIMPHTSRTIRQGEKDGCGYWFTTREKMDADIAAHKYLEYGEYEGHLYGTKLDSIRQVVRSGKMCFLDVNPQSLKVLKTSEFVPYIVFVEAPPLETLIKMHRESAKDNPKKAFSENDLKKSIEESKRLKRQYAHYFDFVIQNNDMNTTYDKLYECISKLSTSPQWVPVSWVH